MAKMTHKRRGWALCPASFIRVRANILTQWLIGFNSLGSEVKRLEIEFAKQISAVRVSHSKSDLINLCEGG